MKALEVRTTAELIAIILRLAEQVARVEKRVSDLPREAVRRTICRMDDEDSDIAGAGLSPTYYGEQDENGVDLSLIRENLRRSPTERVRRGDQARRDALRLLVC